MRVTINSKSYYGYYLYFAVTGAFGLVAIAWALYEGHRLDQHSASE